MDKDIEVIDRFVTLRWRPLIDRSVSYIIKEIEESEKSASEINNEYVSNLSQVIDKRSSWSFKSHAIWFVSLILVYFSTGNEDFGFSLIWISSESVRECRGLLLMAFSFSMIIHSLTYINLNYLKHLRTALYSFVYERELIPFKKAIFEENDFSGIVYKQSIDDHHWFKSAILMMFASIYAVILVIFIVFVVFMVFSVAKDLHANPIGDGVTQAFVLTLFYSGISAQIGSILLLMPLPGKDYSNLELLAKIEAENPVKHREILRNIFFHQRRRYRRNCFVYGSIVYIFIFAYLSNSNLGTNLHPIAFILASVSLEMMFRAGQVIRKRTLELTISGNTKLIRAVANISHIVVVMAMPWGIGWLLVENFAR
ncbi:hypothetical protein [Thalassospira xiamenensis]|uniref:hypothetical protein n=1 Tax=Thalassospira xiamenensis TaxID=220697 RepID=UPI003AA7E264